VIQKQGKIGSDSKINKIDLEHANNLCNSNINGYSACTQLHCMPATQVKHLNHDGKSPNMEHLLHAPN
jgi:hypothetical protein